MAGDPKNPEVWELSVDASELKPFLVERTDTRQGLLIERDGFAVVDGEIRSNQPVYGDQAGITAGDFTKYTTTCDHIAACDRFLPVLQRMLNNVVRTRADAVDKRERLINSFAKSCDERAKVHEDDSLRVQYTNMRAYRSVTALKSAKTRRRNEAEEAAAEAEEHETTQSPAPTATTTTAPAAVTAANGSATNGATH